MNLKQKIAWQFDTVTLATEVARERVAMQLAKLPRPFKEATDKQVADTAGKAIGAVITMTIGLKTGKMVTPFLVDRRLNGKGKAAFAVGIAVNGVIVLLAAHELYVRANSPKSLSHEEADDMIRRLVGL